MDNSWINAFLMHSDTNKFKDLVQETRAFIQLILKEFKKPYIAYSGGKDSTVLLHLILELAPEIMVLHWDYGPYLIPRDLEHLILGNAKCIGAKNLQIFTSPLYQKLKRNLNNVWGKEFMEKELPLLAEQGYDGSFIGLRAEESVKRKIRAKNKINYDGYLYNIYPLKDWTWKDIFAYLLFYKVPYLAEHYDKYADLMGYDKVRFVTFFDPDFKHLGSGNIDGILMWKFKHLR